MAFTRSPVRSRSGPPSFARLAARYGWQATVSHGLPRELAAKRAKDGVLRSAPSAKEDVSAGNDRFRARQPQ